MLFWKIDEETIRCLINREEISQMGFDIESMSRDENILDEFLDTLVEKSKNYLNWNTENGIQTYVARPLPSDQFLLTISCTFADVMIDRDLDQISAMMRSLKGKITDERINRIYSMTGEEKEEAFQELARDLHNICLGKTDDETETPESDDGREDPAKDTIPSGKILFRAFSDLVRFCAALDQEWFLPSSVYKEDSSYVLLVTFPEGMKKKQADSFLHAAGEYGGICSNLGMEAYYYKEHGKVMIPEEGIRILHMNFGNGNSR